MRKIYVLDEQGHLQEIDAGITEYKELQDGPIITSYKGVPLVGSRVSVSDGELQIAAEPDHRWTEEEVLLWCNSAPTGKYDIISHTYGTEWLIVDYTSENMGGRFRRITPDQDFVYDKDAGWVTISDTSAKALIFKVNNLADIPTTIVVGSRLVLDCYYYSTVGDGNITITKGERTVAAAALKSGMVTPITLTSEVTDGMNEFKYVVTNNGFGSLERQAIGTLGLTGIKLIYTPGFFANQVKSGDVSFPVSFSGTGTKYAYFKITDATGRVSEYKPDTKMVNDSSMTFTLSSEYFSHGENKIETYMYMKDGNSEDILTQTDPVTYKFPYATEMTPIVMTYFDFSVLQEWATINIPYRIWSPDNKTNMSSIKFEIEYTQVDDEGKSETKFMIQEYDSSREAYINNYLTHTAEHKWQISNLPHGMLTFRIYLNGSETPSYVMPGINVDPSDYNFKTIDNYLFNFAANDIMDTKPFDTWESNGHTLNISGLNWTTDGIKTETDKSLKLMSAGRVEMDTSLDLFGLAEGDTGVTFEVDFKVDENASSAEPIIRYGAWDETKNDWADRFGLIVYPTRAVVNYDKTSALDETLVVNYQKGERINLGITIEADQSETTNRYLKIFINGIISKVIHYTVATVFPTGLNKWKFNCSGSEFDLYGFRAYNKPLTSGEMLQNYISNFASVDTKVEMLGINNIFSKEQLTYNKGNNIVTGEYVVDFDLVKGKIGCLVMIMDTLPETKAYLKCHTIYYEKDENNPQVQWDSANNRSMATTYYYKKGALNKQIKVGAQGTSSLEYPRKNFKFKFKDKFYIKGHKNGKDKTITCKADYMDSSGANNITNAQIMENSIKKELWVNTPAAAGARVNLDGFPICIFHANKVDADGIPYKEVDGVRQKPEYLGIFNFNYDKKPKALLGWEDYPNPDYNEEEIKALQTKQEKVNDLVKEYKTLIELTSPSADESKRIAAIEEELATYDESLKGKTGEDLLKAASDFSDSVDTYVDEHPEDLEFKFKGYEFRDNTSDLCLQKGIPNMITFVNANIGYEYRWTYESDWIDDWHDGHLDQTMDGGFFGEGEDDGTIIQYNEEDYINGRWKGEYEVVPPFNRLHVKDGDKKHQIYKKTVVDGVDTYSPVNYHDLGQGDDVWSLDFGLRLADRTETVLEWQEATDGTHYLDGENHVELTTATKYNKVEVVPEEPVEPTPEDPEVPATIDETEVEYTYEESAEGTYVKVGEEYILISELVLYKQVEVVRNNPGLYWQPPYGATWSASGNKWTGGSRYASGEGYYKYRRNPEHECKFMYNDDEPYFSDINYKDKDGNFVWKQVHALDKLYARHVSYVEDVNGEFIKDPKDKAYYHERYYDKYIKNEDGTYTKDASGTYVVKKFKNDVYSYSDMKNEPRYREVIEYVPVSLTDELVIEDFMKHVFAHWFYCIDTLCHIKNTPDSFYKDYKPLIDSRLTYKDELGDNGNGLFILDALLNYYCSSVTVALCDNFCKNMMIHSYDDGKTWSPAWYDMDTCFGLNNTGAYVFDYDCDFKDPSTFNGSGSKLWDGLYNCYMPEINAMYRVLRGTEKEPNGQKLAYKKTMDIVYGQNIKYKSEAMYNSTAFFRYIIPDLDAMSGTQLPAAQGNRLSLLRYWLSNRQVYLDSRYGSDDYSSDKITMRMSAPKTINFEITPDTTMYLGLAFNQADASMPDATSRSGKVKEGTTWKYTYPVDGALQDLNTYIFGASHLTDIGDISVCTPKNINIQGAYKLKRFILGTDDPEVLARHDEVSATQGIALTMPNKVCKNMKEIDLHNLKYLDFGGGSTALSLVTKEGSIITNLYPALEKLDIRGSNINAVVIGDYTPLQYIGYSDNLTTIDLKNLPQLTTVEFGDISKVMSINLLNCSSLNQHEILSLFVGKPITVSADNLQIAYEEAVTTEYMDWLMSINASLAGHVHVQNIADSNLDKYRQKWPDLTVDLYQIYADEVIFGVSGEGE